VAFVKLKDEREQQQKDYQFIQFQWFAASTLKRFWHVKRC